MNDFMFKSFVILKIGMLGLCYADSDYLYTSSRNCKYHSLHLKNFRSMEIASHLCEKKFDTIEIGCTRINPLLADQSNRYTVINLFNENHLIMDTVFMRNIKNVALVDDIISDLNIESDMLISDNFLDYLRPETFKKIEPLVKNTKHGLIISHIDELHREPFSYFWKWFYQNGYTIRIIKNSQFFSVIWDKFNLSPKNTKELNSSQNQRLSPEFNPVLHSNAITYSLMGRLGDSLIAYFHAKWLAYKHGVPFVFLPFQSCELFQLTDIDPCVNNYSFKNIVTIQSEDEIFTEPNSTLFVVPYMPECEFEYNMYKWGPLPFIKVDWNDQKFHQEFTKALTPKNPITTIELPTDRITVGVHVRRGGGYDSPTANLAWPLKFPPDTFYIEQIDMISKVFPNQRIFVLILTDDLQPEEIATTYRNALNNSNIEISYRSGTPGPHTNILEDFFTIPKFDCLILCKSNFSLMASKLKKYAILVTPTHAEVVNDKIIIDEVEIQFSTAFLNNLSDKGI